MRQRLYSILRSRRLAVWLIVATVLYSFVGTLVPQEYFTPAAEMSTWAAANPGLAAISSALGLHNAFRNPAFLVLALLLTASTVACSVERTARARSEYTGMRTVSPRDRDRLLANPSRSFVLRGGDPGDALDTAEEVLRDAGLSILRDGDAVSGSSRAWGLLGSPLFHWSLAALFVFAALGQATRSEGKIGLPVGHPVMDHQDSYQVVRRGPFASPPGSGGTWLASDFVPELIDRGVERGFAARVSLSDEDDRRVASGVVYPNRPLRSGSMLAHRDGWGLATVIALEGPEGQEIGRRFDYYDFETMEPDGRIRVDLEAPADLGVTALIAAIPLDRMPSGQGAFRTGIPQDPRVEFAYVAPDGSGVSAQELRPGDVLPLPEGGMSLRLIDVTPYFRAMVVVDWTVPFVYASFLLATIFAALALFWPPRRVLCAVDTSGSETRLKVSLRARRIDPAFGARIANALQERLGDRTG